MWPILSKHHPTGDKIKVKKEETYIKFLGTLNGVAVIVEFDGKGTFNKMEKGVFWNKRI